MSTLQDIFSMQDKVCVITGGSRGLARGADRALQGAQAMAVRADPTNAEREGRA